MKFHTHSITHTMRLPAARRQPQPLRNRHEVPLSITPRIAHRPSPPSNLNKPTATIEPKRNIPQTIVIRRQPERRRKNERWRNAKSIHFRKTNPPQNKSIDLALHRAAVLFIETTAANSSPGTGFDHAVHALESHADSFVEEVCCWIFFRAVFSFSQWVGISVETSELSAP
jgi:hypothetical protein